MRVLEGLGIDTATESVYRAMLAHPDLGVDGLARELGLPSEAVRSTLDRLADLSLLRPSSDRPGQMWPVSPEVGLAALFAQQQVELARQQYTLEQGRAALAAFVAEHSAAGADGPGDTAERLIGLDGVRRRLEELAASARSEALSFLPRGAQSAASMAASGPLDQASLERGVALRTIYLDSARNDPATAKYAAWLSSLGGETRTVPTLPLRMIVIDREVAMLPLDPESSTRGAVLTRQPGTVTALVALFEQVWSTAAPLGGLAHQPPGTLSGAERQLLRMLAAGAKDEAAAREFGVSVRTVRRMMAELAERLHASSRFQAGVHAAREGWI
ncbi:MAG: LuxR C-terminal-related transcriptional regulator [Pseudonocardiales bacterium]